MDGRNFLPVFYMISEPLGPLPKNIVKQMGGLGVPICKSRFDWTVTAGQQSRAKIMSFSVFIFSKFIWEAFFFKYPFWLLGVLLGSYFIN